VPDDPRAKLEDALIACADALAALPPRQFEAMCREEGFEIVVKQQYFAAMGTPTSFPPETVLGHRVIELLAERHPHVLGGPPEDA
jgi:hypothetical protein